MEDTPESQVQTKDTPESVTSESKELQDKLAHYEKILAEKDKQIDTLMKASEISAKAQETLANSLKNVSGQAVNEDPYAWIDRELQNFQYNNGLQDTITSANAKGVRDIGKAWMRSCLQSGMSREKTYDSLERIFKEMNGEKEPKPESPEEFDKKGIFV